jgi:hypothetical protein
MSQTVVDVSKMKDFDSKAAIDFLSGLMFGPSSANPITAHAGGTQAAAVLLVANAVNVIGTVTSAADSVKLPVATKAFQWVLVINNAAANSMQVFGSGTDTIGLVATATGVAQAAQSAAIYIALTATGTADNWVRVYAVAP